MIGLRRKIHTADASRSLRLSGVASLMLGLAAAGVCVGAPATAVRSLDQLSWAVADFDGDSQPDLAVGKMEARSGGVVYWLELDLSTSHKPNSPETGDFPWIGTSLFGLHLTPRDVDGDHYLDLVVTVGVKRLPVAVWINDGRGRFAEGDLASYPALNPADEFSLSAPAGPKTIPPVYDEGRRSRFGLPSGFGAVRPFLPRDFRPASGLSRLKSQPSCEQAPARAPPFQR